MKLFIILHNIRSAYNVGSIFRTADAAGVEKIYLGGYTPDPSQEEAKIAKTALGAEKTVPWERCQQTWRLLDKLKNPSFAKASTGEGRVQIVALEQSPQAIDYREFKPTFPMALVLGNEVGGLSKEILKYADKIIAIPMYGQKESLNVSVAFGIAAFKIREVAS
ncbi:MAG: TrmH family RNA methyltransferase [bacterium]|nr:TrmH family RNA methyltransferase [bacterium]